MNKAEFKEESKKLLERNRYSIIETEKLKWADMIVEKDEQKYSVSLLNTKQSSIKEIDIMVKWVKADMYKHPLIIISESKIDNILSSKFPEIIFLSLK